MDFVMSDEQRNIKTSQGREKLENKIEKQKFNSED